MAMVVAMGVLAGLMVLTATVLSSSQVLGGATNADGLRKQAFEAAQAGLQTTVYRLNMLAPSAANCIGGAGETVQAPSGAACPPYTESLGNGATFTSWTTAALAAGGTCAGAQVGAAGTISERCVTATGTVDGITRRVQARVASYASAPVFPVAGVVGLTSIDISNNATVLGPAGSNGLVSISNNGSTSSVTLGPSAPAPSLKNHASPGPITWRTLSQGPFSLAPVNPGNSATTSDDVRLSNLFASPPLSPADSSTGNVTWNASTRTLSLSNNSSVTLGGGLYNFCQLSLSNNSTVTLAAGARTAIFIDSPERVGSGCPLTTGTFSMSNNSSFVNNSPPVAGTGFAHDPTALQLYVVGKVGAGVTLRNNTDFYGTVYAPTSALSLSNNGDMWGAVAAGSVDVSNNGTITGDPNAANIIAGGGGNVYFGSAWRECLAAPTTSDPGSGC